MGGAVGYLDVFEPGDVEQVIGDDGVGDAAEVEPLATADDRRQHLLRIRGGKDEFGVWRRLLQHLEQAVESGRAEHVHLVDVDDAELPAHRREAHRFPQVAHLLNAVVRCAVDLKHVHAAAFGDFHAHRGVRVEVGLRATGAVEGFGEDAGGRCFAGAARTDEQVGMGDAILRDGIAQCPHDVFLSEDVVERPRAILAGKNLVTHRGGEP